jgi:hypothetical protein
VFLGRVDEPAGLAVWLFTRGPNTDDDWRSYCESLRHATRVAAGRATAYALQVIDVGSEDPTAKWRREIAHEMRASVPHAHVVVATRSRMVRFVLTAIQWLQPVPCELQFVPSELEALERLEQLEEGLSAKARLILAELRAKSLART